METDYILADTSNPNHDEQLIRNVQLGNMPLVDKILEKSTSVTPFVKRNIIREAIAHSQIAMITHLIQRADFAIDLLLWNSTTESQYNILEYAIVLDKTAVAVHILEHHLDSVRQVEPSRSITLAVERNNRDVLRALLKYSSNSYIIRSYQDQINLALVTAAQHGFVGIVEEILAKNCGDPDVVHIIRAIKLAANHGNIGVIDLLAKTFNFDLSDDQWELFRAACMNGQVKVLEWLLLQVKVRVDHLYLVDTFLSVAKSEKQPTDVAHALLEHTTISLVADVYPRKLLLFLKRHLRHEMFGTLSAHLMSKGHDVRAILLVCLQLIYWLNANKVSGRAKTGANLTYRQCFNRPKLTITMSYFMLASTLVISALSSRFCGSPPQSICLRKITKHCEKPSNSTTWKQRNRLLAIRHSRSLALNSVRCLTTVCRSSRAKPTRTWCRACHY
jgi:hypothetical protein